ACCQFAPIWSDVKGSMKKAERLLEIYQPGDIDILILPEMCFTGYVFHSLEEIMPFLEDTENGPTVQWAKKQAIRLHCHVMAGYPQGIGSKCYNSICFVDPQGTLVYTYQKTFLFETDENWAIEGPGFVATKLDGLGKVGFGICMDLNPYRFEADFYDYEFARYHLNQDTDLILCSMAWLCKSDETENPMETIKYWAARLYPLSSEVNRKKHTRVVICNRIGSERGVHFAGGSCAFDISKNRVVIKNSLQRKEGVLIVEYD
ncbi:carbon-nitrogen hydrolase, partial [Pilobolus umbonatus]